VSAIVAALGAASLGRQYLADRYRADAASALATDPADSLRSSRRALQLNPASMEAQYVRAAAFARYSEYGPARATLLRAVGREPTNFVPWGLLGDLAVRRGNLRAAAEAYRNASRLNPRDADLRRLVSDPQAALR
jgi:predicted Zn-dependent protease